MTCPRCGHATVYHIRRYDRRRCANPQCKFDFSPNAMSVTRYNKKPRQWYARIIELAEIGLSAHQIASALGDPRNTYKSVWTFLKKWRAERASR